MNACGLSDCITLSHVAFELSHKTVGMPIIMIIIIKMIMIKKSCDPIVVSIIVAMLL